MTTFIILRKGKLELTTMGKVSLGSLFLCLIVFTAQTWYETCQKLSPIEWVTTIIM